MKSFLPIVVLVCFASTLFAKKTGPACSYKSIRANTGTVTNTSVTVGYAYFGTGVTLADRVEAYYGVYPNEPSINAGVIDASLLLNGLTPGTKYNIKVVGTYTDCDTGLDITRESTVTATTTLPSTPVNVQAINITASSFDLRWSNTNGAEVTSFTIDISTVSDFASITQSLNPSSDKTQQSIASLSANTKYHYRIRANASTLSSAYAVSNSSGVLTLPGQPTALAATLPSQNSFRANWNSVPGLTYLIDVATDPNFTALLNSYSNKDIGPVSNFDVTLLTAGTKYFYRVRAANVTGASVNSTPVISIITIPPDPILSPASGISNSGFIVNWQLSSNATGYTIQISSVPDFSTIIATYSVGQSVNSQAISSLPANVTCYYRVRANNGSGSSGYSGGSVLTKPNIPINFAVSEPTKSSFKLTWTSQAGLRYKLDVATDQDFNFALPSYSGKDLGNVNSFNVLALESGVKYYCRLRANNATGDSDNTIVLNVITIPRMPELLPSSAASNTSFTINWQLSSNVTGFSGDISTSNNFSDIVENFSVAGNVSSKVVPALTSNTLYYYRLRASNGSGNSDYSVGTTLTKPNNPNTAAATQVAQSSFQANWTSQIGLTYVVDVASDLEFKSMVMGYQGKSVGNSNKLTVSALAPGTAYYYRVRAVNETGESESSESITLVTSPANPVIAEVSELSSSRFTIHWNPSLTASEYLIDVATDENFSSSIAHFSVGASANSQSVESVNGNTVYYYRIKAVSASGPSEFSVSSVLTKPNAPIVTSASQMTQSSFMANWTAITGVTYFIDVATDTDFNTIVSGYKNKDVGSVNTMNIGSLSAGSFYFYRVRAVNASGVSSSSDVITALTIPAQPQNFVIKAKTSNAISIEWMRQENVTRYELDVSKTQDFNSLVAGYNPFEVDANYDGIDVTGLQPDTQYFLRIRAVNSSGKSPNSLPRATSTSTATGGASSNDIGLDNYLVPQVFTTSAGTVITVRAKGGIGVIKVYLFHKKCTDGGSYISEEISPTQAKEFSISINPDWLDEIGVQVYVKIEDSFGNFITTEPSIISLEKPCIIPLFRFGKDSRNYHIISIPEVLVEKGDRNIEGLLVELLGDYKNTDWRLARFENGQLVDYPNLRVRKFERGKGYWFISKSAVALNFGNATSSQNSSAKPFEMILESGWNQIGNPYPFDISWKDILLFNGNPTSVRSEYFVFDPLHKGFVQNGIIRAYSGGYVYAEAPTTLKVPTTISLGTSSGRKKESRSYEENGISSGEWLLPIQVQQGDIIDNNAVLGMKNDAAVNFDRYDRIAPPKFFDYARLTSIINDVNWKAATNIVPVTTSFIWKLSLESNGTGPAQLSWDPTFVEGLQGQLILVDLSTGVVLDMAKNSSYWLKTGNAALQARYYKEQIFNQTESHLGVAFPNPFKSGVKIPVDFSSDSSGSIEVTLTVRNLMGHEVFKGLRKVNGMDSLVKEIEWDGNDSGGHTVASGVYTFVVDVVVDGTQKRLTGKLVKE